MKWFKHDSDAGNDAKLRKLRIKYGAQGYGIYWYCLELIARNVEKHNLTFELEHDAELIADDFKLSGELVQEMMTYMVNLGLFENTQGVITCLKMSSRTDEYTAKLLTKIKNTPDNVPTISDESPTKSELIEEKRREEIYTPDFLSEINPQILKDYLKVRKAKKAGEFTQTSFNMIKNEALKVNLNINEALAYCCKRGWQGFESSWYLKDNPKKQNGVVL